MAVYMISEYGKRFRCAPSFNYILSTINKTILMLWRTKISVNRSSRRKRGMASNPLFIISDFFLYFPIELSYGYLRFEGLN